jgi:uncharacterized protein DUF4389
MAAAGTYPVRVEASLDSPLSRWLWLVKWLLVIPHVVVLAFLWLAFAVLSVAAFFAILFTGRYPRGIFDFNVGVLRWTWRVQYYAIGAFGTDRYPPFTLADDPSYPARLEIAYPGRLSRGLVLVKWWLLAIPHYIIVALFTGGGLTVGWLGYQDSRNLPFSNLGLIGILTVISGFVLLFTGNYPAQLFDFVLGMNRWVLRVAAYAGLMTDRYPPFRLDMGGHDPDGTLTLTPPQPPAGADPGSGPGTPSPGHGPGQQAPPRAPGWTAGRIVSLVIGAVLALCSLGALGAGGAAVWADSTQRHAGYVDLGSASYTTAGRALASETISVHGGLTWLRPLIGEVRIKVTGTGGAGVFAGIAPASAASKYLSGVAYTTVTSYDGLGARIGHSGSGVPRAPASTPIWAAQASGARTATLSWTLREGDWTVIVMNADRSAGVTVGADVAASLPALGWLAAELLAGGVVLALIALACIVVPVRLAAGYRAGRAVPGS